MINVAPPTKKFANGMAAWVYRMTFGKGRICLGYEECLGYEAGWCYESFEAALIALAQWDGEGDPPGWFRNLQTGRYRTNGDPAKEYGPDTPPENVPQ